MQQLLVVLAVHLMSVVAGPGRASAAPVQPSISTTTLRPLRQRPHGIGRTYVSSDLTPWNPDSRSERSLGVWRKIKQQKFLTSKNGWTLEIMPNGSVTSTRDPKPKYGILQTEPVNPEDLGLSISPTTQYNTLNNSRHYGKVAILGFHSQRFLCMGKNGVIYTRSQEDQIKNYSRECVFVEHIQRSYYLTFCSFSFPKRKPKLRKDGTPRKPKRKSKRMWCLGINKNGTIRSGRKTRDKHSFAHFTTRQIEDPTTPFPRPSFGITRPVSEVTPTPPSGVVIKGPNPTESRRKGKRRRQNRRKEEERKGCKGPGLFNIRCRDSADVISDVSQLKRKSSRRRSGSRSRSSNNRRKDRRKQSRIDTIGLFTG